ncbi:MAG: DNA polymerase III subunit delta [Saprospiraceae bacterium]
MSAEVLIKDIKDGKISPLYLLHGEESYYIDQISDALEEYVLTEQEKAFNLMVYYGKDVDHRIITDECRQFPMMSQKRLVILKEAQEMKTLTELQSYAENPVQHTVLVICYKYKKVDLRTKFAKAFQQKGVVFESAKLYDNKVPSWIQGYAASKGFKIDPSAAQMVAEYIGSDLTRIASELDKATISHDPKTLISKQLIQDQIGINKDFNVFELTTALGNKNFTKAHQIIKYFSENPKSNPLNVVNSMIFSYFVKVLIVAQNSHATDTDLVKIASIPSTFFVQEYRNAAKKYSLSHLKKIFLALKKADQHSKGYGASHGEESFILKDVLIACMMP